MIGCKLERRHMVDLMGFYELFLDIPDDVAVVVNDVAADDAVVEVIVIVVEKNNNNNASCFLW